MHGEPGQRPDRIDRDRVVWPSGLDPSGVSGPTRHQAKGRRWRRTSHGLYVPTSTEPSLEQRVVEAAAVLPSYGGVTGWAALFWLGARWFDGTEAGRGERDVTLATGPCDIRPQAGITVSAEKINPRDLITTEGLRMTVPSRSVLFEMRHAPDVRTATEVMDMAAYDDVVSIVEALDHAAQTPAWTGIPQARAALALADENSWSPAETRLRLLWTLDAGLPRPLCNVPLFDLTGRHIGTPDLFDPEVGLVGEYDGALHLAGRQRSRDLAREHRFRSHGLEYVAVVGHDLRRPDQVVERLHAARDRAGGPSASSTWTLVPPPWWTPARSVAARRLERIRRDVRPAG
jgi:hypothetical protein